MVKETKLEAFADDTVSGIIKAMESNSSEDLILAIQMR